MSDRIRGRVKGPVKNEKPGSIGKTVYEGTLPTEKDYKKLTRILVIYQGKETVISVKPERVEATLEKYGSSVVRVLKKIKTAK